MWPKYTIERHGGAWQVYWFLSSGYTESRYFRTEAIAERWVARQERQEAQDMTADLMGDER